MEEDIIASNIFDIPTPIAVGTTTDLTLDDISQLADVIAVDMIIDGDCNDISWY